MQQRRLRPTTTGSTVSSGARLNALHRALLALNAYMLDECPDGQNWEDFDPHVDELRTQINDLIEAG